MEIKFSETYSNEWYIFKNCKQHGPLSSEDICNLLMKNQITKDHHIWNQSFNDWVAIKDIETFKNVGFNPTFAKDEISFIESTKTPYVKETFATTHSSKKIGFFEKLKSFFTK